MKLREVNPESGGNWFWRIALSDGVCERGARCGTMMSNTPTNRVAVVAATTEA